MRNWSEKMHRQKIWTKSKPSTRKLVGFAVSTMQTRCSVHMLLVIGVLIVIIYSWFALISIANQLICLCNKWCVNAIIFLWKKTTFQPWISVSVRDLYEKKLFFWWRSLMETETSRWKIVRFGKKENYSHSYYFWLNGMYSLLINDVNILKQCHTWLSACYTWCLHPVGRGFDS